MQRILDELTATLVERSHAAPRTIVGIAGAPGSGKSTLAAAVAERLGGSAAVVPMDGYHLANTELVRLERRGRKGAPDTFDSAGYVSLLRRLRAQAHDEIVYAPEFRREIEEAVAGAVAVLPEHRIVVTEGNYLLLADGHWSAVRSLLDICWFIDVDPDLRRDRLIARHVRFGRTPAAAREWVAHTDDPNAALIEATRVRADLVVRIDADGAPDLRA